MKNPKHKLTPKEIERRIASNIKQAREAKGLTQIEVADALGVGYQAIQKYETEGRRIYCGVLWQLADIIKVPPSTLFAGVGKASDENNVISNHYVYDIAKALTDVPEEVQKSILDVVKAISTKKKAKK